MSSNDSVHLRRSDPQLPSVLRQQHITHFYKLANEHAERQLWNRPVDTELPFPTERVRLPRWLENQQEEMTLALWVIS